MFRNDIEKFWPTIGKAHHKLCHIPILAQSSKTADQEGSSKVESKQLNEIESKKFRHKAKPSTTSPNESPFAKSPRFTFSNGKRIGQRFLSVQSYLVLE